MKKIKFLRALKHDNALFGGTLATVLFSIIIIFLLTSEDPSLGLNYGWILLILIGYIVLRFMVLKSYYKDGFVLEGTIDNITFYRNRGRASLNYEIDGEFHTVGTSFTKTREVRRLAKESRVEILVKKSNYNKAIIYKLYS